MEANARAVMRSGLWLLGALWAAASVDAQPAPDMPVASYKDDLTPYPLLAGKYGNDPAFTLNELTLLARNFDALYGGYKNNLTKQKVDQLHGLNPNFQVVQYRNGASTGKISPPLSDIEQEHKNDLLYYLTGNAGSALDATATTLTIRNLFGTLVASTADPGRTIGYFTNRVFKFATWLKIDDELMRIETANNNTSTMVATVAITRGFGGTLAAPHASSAPVLAPAYFVAPVPGMTTEVSYFNDPAAPLIRQYLSEAAEAEYQTAHRGIWIDILGGDFNCITMGGEKMNAAHKWDARKGRIYSALDWARYSEEGVNFIQTSFFNAHGFYPVIWGNNLGWPIDPNDTEIRMLKSTAEKPRPIHGFSQEAEIGSFPAGITESDYELFNFATWTNNLRSTMLMGEMKVAAVAVCMDAGSQNANFAQLPNAVRHRLLLYGYASYLMAVRVEPDGRIYSKFGFTPLVDSGTGTPSIQLDPLFLYDIGRPVETRSSSDNLGYMLPGQRTFKRRFENGIVLVNPGDNPGAVEMITLGQACLDPDSGNIVTQVSLAAKTGKVLLNPPASRIANLSVRTNLAANQTLVVGFVTVGARPLLTRAVGPGLVPFGITSGFYPDPLLSGY